MTDLEMTRLCADAMGYTPHKAHTPTDNFLCVNEAGNYDPLHNNAQAMVLIKRFALNCTIWSDGMSDGWLVVPYDKGQECGASNFDLNRAIVECIAKMQQGKKQ